MELIDKLKNGEIKLYEIEKYSSDKSQAVEIRKRYIAEIINQPLDKISKFPFDPEQVYNRNCENVIGGVSLPLGIAGPIKVRGDHANGEYLIPLATTEGALVASVNRGTKIISEAGGAVSISNYIGITRAPLYRVNNIKHARKFTAWISSNFEKLKEIADATDPFLFLKNIEPYSNGKNVWLRLTFDTGDAMGMNMAVLATEAMSRWIEDNFEGVRTIAISGNLCTDKKPAYINQIKGRGRIIESECLIPSDLIEKYLKSTTEKIIEVNKNKIWLGGQMAGSMGFNSHTANMIAALFIATGQDPAQVVEASSASVNMENDNGNLYVNIRIPSLNIATFGGGTGLATQRECQEIILTNVNAELSENENTNQTEKLAEIIGAVVLAGELSLHAAFANNTFVKAHQDLGRTIVEE